MRREQIRWGTIDGAGFYPKFVSSDTGGVGFLLDSGARVPFEFRDDTQCSNAYMYMGLPFSFSISFFEKVKPKTV